MFQWYNEIYTYAFILITQAVICLRIICSEITDVGLQFEVSTVVF